MSLLTSLYTGQTGLDASSEELSVIGDNIANANTVGFKGSRADFSDALAQNLIGDTPSGGGQVGLGAHMEVVQKILTEGSISNTGNPTDLAIQGQGFFVVKGSANGVNGTYYTRDGEFTVDKSGYLVSQAGLHVEGYTATATGAITPTAVGDLQVGQATSPPLATATLTVQANLSSDAVTPAAAWDPLNAAATSNFSTSTTVYDSLGASHQVDIYFRKTAAGAWDYHALTDGAGVTGGTAGIPTEIANGTLTFNTQGALTAQTTTSTFNPINSVDPQALAFNFGTATGAGGTGLDGVTQFSAPSSTSFLNQDGYAAGTLTGISVDAQGKITGAFTNGQSRVVGQVALADFQAPDQLSRTGGNLFAAMPAAGPPTVGQPGTANRGSIAAGALEQSNVDLSQEFVRMIAAQRQFQANAKTLTTSDALLQELMNIKR
ncbi:MAG: flagellar hook protein FlgE [Pseudomonadota bacterium]